jgi:hypothetical protein
VRYTAAMRPLASRITVTLVLLICLVCPLLETFDHWDHTFQTGNDTEYALVVLALCVGLAYSFARVIFTSSVVTSLGGNLFAASIQRSLLLTLRRFARLFFSDSSSPPLPLRV